MTLRQIMNNIVVEALLSDDRLTPTDVAVRMHIQSCPIRSIREMAGLSRVPRETLRRSIRRLVQLDWAYEVPRAGKVRPMIDRSMPLSVEQAVADELARVRRNVPNLGEWLMKCMFDMIVDDDDYHDNARPPWLVSGVGGGRMEIDRWYRSAEVALEFQGPQHYRVGGPYAPSEHALAEQMMRDSLKAGLCAREGIRFIEITAVDLQHHAISSKVAGLLPLRRVREDRPIYRALSKECQIYLNYAAREEKRAHTQG